MTSYRDWVVETSSTTGTGTYNLSGSPPAGTSYFTFRQRFSNGEDEVVYWVVNADRTKWEKNRFGTLTYGTPDTLSRNVIESTNGDAAVSWVGGDAPLRIYVVPDAEAQEFAISMGLAATRPGVLKLGIWADQDDIDGGVHSLKFYDGSAETTVGVVNTVGDQAIMFGLPPGFVKRTMARNSGTPTTKIDVTFTCMDSTDAAGMKRTTALTKRTNGAWVAGNDANGMGNALTIANNTWYHVFAILVDGVVDAYIDTSPTAANKPANTSHFRVLGSFRTNGSAQIIDFGQDGDHFWWAAEVDDAGPLTATGNVTLTVPTGRRVEWQGNIHVFGAAATTVSVYASVPGVTLGTNAASATAAASTNGAATASIMTNTSAQVLFTYVKSGVGSTNFFLQTRGWIDRCGRD